MPGIASIFITCIPLAGYKPAILEKLQLKLDAHFTPKTERALRTLLIDGEPSWEEILTRLDSLLAKTAVGNNKAGKVVPDPNTPIDPRLWNWTPNWHEYIRPLHFKGELWTISVDKQSHANVVAKYSYHHGNVLPTIKGQRSHRR